MALTLARANTILRKLGFPQIRQATQGEQWVDEYGIKYTWAVDQGERQASRTGPSIYSLVGRLLEDHWEDFDATKLTQLERDELRTLPNQVARFI